jgi:hypothetical protein
MAENRVQVVQGENVWLLVRTDRDHATRDEVLAMVGPAMHHMLHEAGEQFADIDPWQIVIPTTPDGKELPNEWRIGAARPIVAVEAERGAVRPFALPAAQTVLWKRLWYEGEGVPLVKATVPWWILVRFWWRHDSADVAMPGYRVNAIGWHESGPADLKEADWLLETAIVPLAKLADPGAQTWGEEMIPRAGKTIKDAATAGLPWALLVGLVAVGGVLAYAFAKGAGGGYGREVVRRGERTQLRRARTDYDRALSRLR